MQIASGRRRIARDNRRRQCRLALGQGRGFRRKLQRGRRQRLLCCGQLGRTSSGQIAQLPGPPQCLGQRRFQSGHLHGRKVAQLRGPALRRGQGSNRLTPGPFQCGDLAAVVIGALVLPGQLALQMPDPPVAVLQQRLVLLAPRPGGVQRLFQFRDAGGAFARQRFLLAAPRPGGVQRLFQLGDAVRFGVGLVVQGAKMALQLGNPGGLGRLQTGQLCQPPLHRAAGVVGQQALFRPVGVVGGALVQTESRRLQPVAQGAGGDRAVIQRLGPGAQVKDVQLVQMARLAEAVQNGALGPRRVDLHQQRVRQRPQTVHHLGHGQHGDGHRPCGTQTGQQVKQRRTRGIQAAMGQIAEQVQHAPTYCPTHRHRQHGDLRPRCQPQRQRLGQVGMRLDQDHPRRGMAALQQRLDIRRQAGADADQGAVRQLGGR